MHLNSAQLVPLIHPNPQTPATMERLAFQEPHRQLNFQKKKNHVWLMDDFCSILKYFPWHPGRICLTLLEVLTHSLYFSKTEYLVG